MEKVQGYLTSDKEFFHTAEEAEAHEAHQALIEAATEKDYDPNAIVQACQSLRSEIKRYIDAEVAAEAVTTYSPRPNDHQADDRSTEADNAGALEQSSGSDEPVPDMGRGVRSTRVRKQR